MEKEETEKMDVLHEWPPLPLCVEGRATNKMFTWERTSPSSPYPTDPSSRRHKVQGRLNVWTGPVLLLDHFGRADETSRVLVKRNEDTDSDVCIIFEKTH